MACERCGAATTGAWALCAHGSVGEDEHLCDACVREHVDADAEADCDAEDAARGR